MEVVDASVFSDGDFIRIDNEILVVTDVDADPTTARFTAVNSGDETEVGADILESTTNVVDISVDNQADLNLGGTTPQYFIDNLVHLRIGSEIVRVLDATGPFLSIQRAALGTDAAAHAVDTLVHRLDVNFVQDVVKIDPGQKTAVNQPIDATRTDIPLFRVSDLEIDDSDDVLDFVRMGNEIMRVTSVAGTSLIVERGVLGTDPQEHVAGAVIETI
ncbi:unnamed protein product, partial [Hapterophycus canaliculatus]